eukprot:3643749-Amphidinium_carterae.2
MICGKVEQRHGSDQKIRALRSVLSARACNATNADAVLAKDWLEKLGRCAIATGTAAVKKSDTLLQHSP